MEFYSTIKWNKLLIVVIARTNPKNSALSEKNNPQVSTHCIYNKLVYYEKQKLKKSKLWLPGRGSSRD
jgi:hypothetical protein